jgi:hypothetical protein
MRRPRTTTSSSFHECLLGSLKIAKMSSELKELNYVVLNRTGDCMPLVYDLSPIFINFI